MNKKKNSTKFHFAGLGLIFGTAVGAVLSIAITGNVMWCGIGTTIGLIAGSIIDTYKSPKK